MYLGLAWWGVISASGAVVEIISVHQEVTALAEANLTGAIQSPDTDVALNTETVFWEASLSAEETVVAGINELARAQVVSGFTESQVDPLESELFNSASAFSLRANLNRTLSMAYLAAAAYDETTEIEFRVLGPGATLDLTASLRVNSSLGAGDFYDGSLQVATQGGTSLYTLTVPFPDNTPANLSVTLAPGRLSPVGELRGSERKFS